MFDVELWEQAQDISSESSPPEPVQQDVPPEGAGLRQSMGRTFFPGPGPLMPGPGQPGDASVEEFKRKNRRKLQELQLRRREFWNEKSAEIEGLGRSGTADRFELMERAGKWASETLENEALYKEYGYERPGPVGRMRQAAMSTTRGVLHGAVVGNLQGGALAYSWLRDLFGAETDGPVEGYQAYQLGAAIAEKAEELTDPRLRNEFLANNVAEGFGSMLAFWATARGGASVFKAAKSKELAAKAAILAQGGALESAALYEDAIRSGASERVAKTHAAWGIPLGATELVGAGRIMTKWNQTTGGAFYKSLKEYWKEAARGGMEEGLQEMFQQEGHEAIAVMIWREHRRPIEESLKAGVTGGILGALMGGLAAAPKVEVLRRQNRASEWFAENPDAAVTLAGIKGKVSRARFEEITGIKRTRAEYRDGFRNDIRSLIAGEILGAVDAETEAQIQAIERQRESQIRAQNQQVLEEVTDPIRRVGMGGVASMDIQTPAAEPVAPLQEPGDPVPGVDPAPAPTVQELGIEDPAAAPVAPAAQPAAVPVAPVAQPAAVPVAQPAEFQQGESIVPEVPTVQKVDEGAVVTADEQRVLELKEQGLSDEVAVQRAASEEVAPQEVQGEDEVVEKGRSQADVHVFGQANTVVSPEEAAAAIELLKQKGLAIGRGEKPTTGGAAAIDTDMLRAIGQIGMYYAEALARAGLRLTPNLFRRYLRRFAPFNQRQPNNERRWLIPNRELDAAIHAMMEATPEGMAAGAVAGAFNNVARNVRKRVILNRIIRWREGETVEATAKRLLEWSMQRQALSADRAYRASVIDENESWESIIEYAREVLPPEMHGRIARLLDRMARSRMRTQKGVSRSSSARTYEQGRENARQMVIQAINNLVEQYERAAAISGLKEMLSQSNRMNLRPETQEVLETLIEDIVFQDPNQSTLESLESLRNAAELDEQNATHQIPKALVDHARDVLSKHAARGYGVRSMRQDIRVSEHDVVPMMTAEEIRTLTETIGQLLNQMTVKNRLLERRKNRTLQEIKEESARNVAARFDANRSIEPGNADDVRTMVWFKKLAYLQLLSMDSMAHILGGRDSAVYHIFSEALRRARDGVADIQVEAQDHIRPVLEQLGLVGPVLTEWSEMGSRDRGIFVTIFKTLRGETKQAERIETPLAPLQQRVVFEDGSEILVEASNDSEARAGLTGDQRGRVAYTRPVPTATRSNTGERVESISLTRAERVSLYLHLQDRDTRSEILSHKSNGITIAREESAAGAGIRLTIHDVLAIEASMTQEEIAVANAMSEFFNGSLRQQINASWVEHHGTEIANNETYFPRTRDQHYFQKGVDEVAHDWQEAHLDGQGIFRARARNVSAPIVVFDAFSVYYAHTNRAASFIAKHGALSDAFEVLNSSEFQDSVKQNHPNGAAWIDQMREMLTKFQGLEVRKGSLAASETIIRSIIRASHISALGLKPQIALYQLASFIAAGTEISAKYLWSASRNALSPSLLEEMKASSATIRQRLESGGHQILSPGYQGSALMEFFGATHRDYAGSKQDKVEKASMAMIKKGDTTVIATIWGAAKLEGAEQGLTGDALIEYARKRTIDIIDQTQPTWDSLTSSHIQNLARNSALLKLLVMFSSQRNKNFNMAMRSAADYSASEKTAGDKGVLAGKLFTVLGAQSALVFYSGKAWFFLLAMLWGDDDQLDKLREEDWRDDVAEIFKKSMGNWLIIGDGVSSIMDVWMHEGSLPPSYRRQRGTVLAGIGKDFLDAGHYLHKGLGELAADERYGGLGPRVGRRKAKDSLSQALDKFIRAGGMVAGLPTGALMQVFGRAMPHRRPVKWRHEPVNQLNNLDRDYSRAGADIRKLNEKLSRDPGNPDLRRQLDEAKKARRSSYIAHRIWSYAEGDILKSLAEAKKGRRVDKIEVMMERTRLESLADAYQSYAKTGSVDQLIRSSDDAFLGEILMDYTRLDPRADPLKSVFGRERKVEKIAEERRQVEPLVKAMSYQQAESALTFGYMSASESKSKLNAIAASIYARQHRMTPKRAIKAVREMDQDKVVSIILSRVHDRGRRRGRPRYRPTSLGYIKRLNKLRESFGVR